MCRITVVVYFFTLLLSCHVQNSSQLSAGQILQCQDCMRAVKQIYSIRYIDISIVLSLCLPSLAELHPMAFQWNRSLPSIRQKMLEACVFHRGPWSSVLPQIFALLLSGIPVGSCVNVDKNFFIRKQTKILGWVLPCVISRRASICRIKWCKMLAVVVSFSQPLTLNFSWNLLLRNSWKSLSSSSLSPKISARETNRIVWIGRHNYKNCKNKLRNKKVPLKFGLRWAMFWNICLKPHGRNPSDTIFYGFTILRNKCNPPLRVSILFWAWHEWVVGVLFEKILEVLKYSNNPRIRTWIFQFSLNRFLYKWYLKEI